MELLGFGDCLDGGFSPVENGVDIHEEVGDWEEQVLEVDSRVGFHFYKLVLQWGKQL